MILNSKVEATDLVPRANSLLINSNILISLTETFSAASVKWVFQ